MTQVAAGECANTESGCCRLLLPLRLNRPPHLLQDTLEGWHACETRI